jgi:hypothetical protein
MHSYSCDALSCKQQPSNASLCHAPAKIQIKQILAQVMQRAQSRCKDLKCLITFNKRSERSRVGTKACTCMRWYLSTGSSSSWPPSEAPAALPVSLAAASVRCSSFAVSAAAGGACSRLGFGEREREGLTSTMPLTAAPFLGQGALVKILHWRVTEN